MTLRWILPLAAVACVAGALWVTTSGGKVTPEELLGSARAQLAAVPPDRAGAQRELDEALRLARGAGHADLRARIYEERSKLYAAQGLHELALADCRARLAESGADPDTLARACDLCLWLGEPGLALEFASQLSALDLARGQGRTGRCRVALADSPLAALETLASHVLPPSLAATARALAQRAAVFADDEHVSSAAEEELLELFTRADERRKAEEWVREAAEHFKAARVAFIASLAPGTTNEAVAGLQDLLLRGGAERETADLGGVALAITNLADPMPVLARTASALVSLGREESARALILDLRKRNPGALRPEALPSLALRDELLEWCRLLAKLEMWDELRAAAATLARRGGADKEHTQLAHLLSATAELRQGQLGPAQRALDQLGTLTGAESEIAVRAWLARAEIARRQGQRKQERHALLIATKAAPLDPPAELRDEVGRAWERAGELQYAEGDFLAAEISLTHALRCSSARATEIEPMWHRVGKKSLASRGVASPYVLYTRAKNQDDRDEAEGALNDAHALLKEYPGLGPALEIVSRSASKLHDYPAMIAASLELLERGWTATGASARLRTVPKEYFLPHDRVRWLLFDPRGSLEDVVLRLLEKGDLSGASLAARGGPAKYQPEELLPLLARVTYDDGLPGVASETLALLPAEDASFRASTGLALRAALAQFLATGQEAELAPVVEKVTASSAAVDPTLPAALDAWMAAGRQREVEALLAWLAPQSPPFLAEALLRQTAGRVLAGGAGASDEDLERAAALLADGRPELGRLVLALEGGDAEGLAREARAALATPLAAASGRRAALLVLAGRDADARELAEGAPVDGRDALLELVAGCFAARTSDPAAIPADAPFLPALLLESVPPERALVLALAAELPPWSAWMLARTAALPRPAAQDAWMRVLRAQGWLSLELAAQARAELWPTPVDEARADAEEEAGERVEEPVAATQEDAAASEAGVDARVAWMRVRLERARGAEAPALLEAELEWLERCGLTSAEEPALARLEAEQRLRDGSREEAVRVLEAALERQPDDVALRERLAALEDVAGRRTRSIELYGRVLAARPGRAGDAPALALLDVLRGARDEGEISEARWWAEVEALESERPEDPAPPRELAQRAFETGANGELGRTHALERLARFRSRTLGRALERLRPGEAQRWTRLLGRYTPERAVSFAEEELRRDPSDPDLWRAAAEALLAAGRHERALEHLEALQRVAPELETARLVALTRFRLTADRKDFRERLAALARLDPGTRDDVVLSFYAHLTEEPAAEEPDGLTRALELWAGRAENGLAEPEHGRALALALFDVGRREPAVATLLETHPLAQNALAKDVVEALVHLMKAAPAAPRRLPDGAPRPAAGADDAPGAKGAKAPGAAGARPAQGGAAKPKAGAKPGKGKASGGKKPK